MATETVPYGRATQNPPAVAEVHIVWITAGLGCDGDSVAITSATQPSIEDILLGAIPGLPKVHLHNPVLAYEVGAEFLDFYCAPDAIHSMRDPTRGGIATTLNEIALNSEVHIRILEGKISVKDE